MKSSEEILSIVKADIERETSNHIWWQKEMQARIESGFEPETIQVARDHILIHSTAAFALLNLLKKIR